jgi:CRP-like cAMP-binding protein
MAINAQAFFGEIKTFPAKTILLKEGSVARHIYLIKRGCVRACTFRDGSEITLHFFFEGDTVTSFESFLRQQPSGIQLETLEETEMAELSGKHFFDLISSDTEINEWFYSQAVEKLIVHTNRLLNLLKFKPIDRYRQLIVENPELFKRVSQHYIASYLGITSVSLSRIKNRKC